ncbi:MAG: hypothetical protein DMF72_14230 [Acidobacteria bacterium]|nr:MAG: hypothetical protein DMF72_14230 [Acidobacteriota bacterium]
MSANTSDLNTTPQSVTAVTPAVPKRITNAQTVCNERNEKNKLCNGHLKQLKTAGEASEVHLRGDDVLFKCQICGTLYMGPPLGHVRDPEKQKRFVEAELSALLQAAGGTLPVIQKNEKGVYVIVEAEAAAHGHAAPALSAKPAAAAKPATPPVVAATPSAPAAQATTVAEKAMTPPAPKAAAEPNRSLNKRSTYAGVVDTGPVPGETKDEKIARLQRVVAGAKQHAEEGGGQHAAVTVVDSSPSADAHRPAAEAQAETGAASAAPLSAPAATASPVAGAETPAELAPDAVAPATTPTPTTSHSTSGEPDRTLMKRSTYGGVQDTGPVAGETHEQKIERLTKVVAAAKQRAEEGV